MCQYHKKNLQNIIDSNNLYYFIKIIEIKIFVSLKIQYTLIRKP